MNQWAQLLKGWFSLVHFFNSWMKIIHILSFLHIDYYLNALSFKHNYRKSN
jgi:hypothetical protein